MIQLDKNYKIQKHEIHGFTLLFEEQRIREKTKVIDKKKVKTGETENYTFNDAWYYPKLQMALEKYIDLTFSNEQSILDLIEKIKNQNEILTNIEYK